MLCDSSLIPVGRFLASEDGRLDDLRSGHDRAAVKDLVEFGLDGLREGVDRTGAELIVSLCPLLGRVGGVGFQVFEYLAVPVELILELRVGAI